MRVRVWARAWARARVPLRRRRAWVPLRGCRGEVWKFVQRRNRELGAGRGRSVGRRCGGGCRANRWSAEGCVGRTGGCVGVAQEDADGGATRGCRRRSEEGVDEREVECGGEHEPGGHEHPHAELEALLQEGGEPGV